MPSAIVLPVLSWARKLRFPILFKLTAGLFALSVLLPDPIPFLDELLLDRRGERQGFGYGITGELRLLRMHRTAHLTTPEPASEGPMTDFQATVPMPLEPPPKA